MLKTQNTPTTIFSGFLGSGKTTIIMHLIETLQARGEQVVYIKNEIGETDIDTKLVEGSGIKSKELLNGCICCTLVGPFVSSLTEVVETFAPDRIIIEASGAADPSALALMVSSHPRLERDGVITIIDVLNFTGFADLTITSQNQTKFTDLLIFNKIELADLQQKRAVVGYVRELNSHSPIIEAPNGIVSPDVVFGLNTTELTALLDSKKSHTHAHSHRDNHTATHISNHPENHSEPHNHVHDDAIQAFTLQLPPTVRQSDLENALKKLPKQIFRAKGFFQTQEPLQLPLQAEKPSTDSSDSHQKPTYFIFNTVGTRTTIAPAPSQFSPEDQTGLLVCIGYHAHEYQREVTALVQKFVQNQSENAQTVTL